MTLFHVRYKPDRAVPRRDPIDYGIVVAATADEALDLITERYGALCGRAWFRSCLIATREPNDAEQPSPIR